MGSNSTNLKLTWRVPKGAGTPTTKTRIACVRQNRATSSANCWSVPTSSVKAMIITFRCEGVIRTCLAALAASAIAVKVISMPDSSMGIDSMARFTSPNSVVGLVITGIVLLP